MATSLNIYPMQAKIADICMSFGNDKSQLLEIFHEIQRINGYLPDVTFQTVADQLNISRADAYGVATFYHDFKLKPQKPKSIKICQSEACQAVGSQKLDDEISKILSQHPDFDKSVVYCFGNCALGPNVMIDDQLVARATTQKVQTMMKGASS